MGQSSGCIGLKESQSFSSFVVEPMLKRAQRPFGFSRTLNERTNELDENENGKGFAARRRRIGFATRSSEHFAFVSALAFSSHSNSLGDSFALVRLEHERKRMGMSLKLLFGSSFSATQRSKSSNPTTKQSRRLFGISFGC